MREARSENTGRHIIRSFDDLEVFNRSYAIAIELHELSLKFPKYEQYGGMADQIRRASKSISANIAEGYAKRSLSSAEFKRFLMIAFGSAEEMRIWIRFARDLGYIQLEKSQKFEQEFIEIAKMIYTLHKNWSD